MLIIGSGAMNDALCQKVREPNDVDMIATFEECQNFIKGQRELGRLIEALPISDKKWKVVVEYSDGPTIFEIEIAWEGSSAALIYPEKAENSFADLNTLYALKMSHRYLKNSPYFKKTMDDIVLMRAHGACITPELEEFYNKRVEETYTYEHPKLNQEKKDFFTDNVPYKYDHDSIHRAIALLSEPAYLSFKPKDRDVWCCKDMWDNLNEHIKLNAVIEESAVLAFERAIIPFGVDFDKAYQMALEKVCTSITSGWFREYAWEHYYTALRCGLNDSEYIQMCFSRGVNNGIIKEAS